MTDKTDLIREIHEYVTTHGGENTATHLLVQAASAIQTQAAELEAVGAGGVSGPLMGQPQAMPDLSALTERGAKAWAGVDAQALRDGTYHQAAPKAAPGEPDPADIIAGALQISRGHATEMMREALEAAPQQEAQEPAFWMNEKGHTWSHSDWKQFPKHRAKYPIPLYPHFPTPQPAPDCHHRPPCDECAALAAQGGK